jgi:hypothetical protein
MGNLNIHVFCNDGQRVLYDCYFLPSLKDPWKVCYHPLPNTGPADFGTETFKRLVHEKIKILVTEILPSEIQNEFFILSDVDIQFFSPCDQSVREAMQGVDIALQSEFGNRFSSLANTGFICMRPNQPMIDFWSKVESNLAEQIGKADFVNEQAIVNKMLPLASNIKWAFFPDAIWAYSNLGFRRSHRFPSILLHHANVTSPRDGMSSLELKIEQLASVKELLRTWNDASYLTHLSRRIHTQFGDKIRLVERIYYALARRLSH